MLPLKQMILSSFFAAISALLAQLSIPLPFSPVPITGQMVGVFLAGAIMGKKWGAISILIYVMLGIIGLPVFHNAQGGIHIVLGPTGGYLWGFVLGVYLLGMIVEKRDSYFFSILGMFFCLLVVYFLGTLQLAFIASLGAFQAFLMGVAPYLPADIIKIFASAALVSAVNRHLNKAGLAFRS